MPATTTGTTTTFPFKAGIYTALLTTTDPSLTGDLSAKTLNVTVRVDGGMGVFQYRDSVNCGSPPAKVRFYFTSPKASGPEKFDVASIPGEWRTSSSLRWKVR